MLDEKKVTHFTGNQVKKDTAIETLRGIAVIFMVFGHVVGAKTTDGLKVADNSSWRFVYYSFEYLRMPLFTVISGYIYAYKPLSKFKSFHQFALGKANRLLIPLLVVSTLFYLIQHFSPGTNYKNSLANIRYIYFYPYAHFWFLQGMLIVFLIFAFFESFKLFNSLNTALVCFTAFAVIFIFFPYKINNFSLHKVPYLLTFFTLGVLLKRFDKAIYKDRSINILAFIFITTFGYQLYLFNSFHNIRLEHFLIFSVGSSGCALLIRLKWSSNNLAWLGNFAFAIYLFHILGSVTSRIIMSHLSVENTILKVLSGLTLGITLPVMLMMTLGRYKIFSILFFGEKIAFNRVVFLNEEKSIIEGATQSQVTC